MVNQDKTFLTRENATYHDRIQRLEEQLDTTRADLMQAKKNAESYLERLLNAKDDDRIESYERHTKEIENIREKHQKDLEAARNSLAELYEKKIEFLSEGKEESDGRLARAERLLREKERLYDDLLVEHRKIEKITDKEIGDVRSEL